MNRRKAIQLITASMFAPLLRFLQGFNPLPRIGWKCTFQARILNDSFVHVITGPPEEMERFYEALKKEYPELCEAT
jgi:hypothetical protein